jgi:tetratricopeptide (TPR) repeat protein
MKILLGSALAFGLSGDMTPPAPDEVMRLPEAVIEQLDETIYRASNNPDRRLDLLARMMFARDGLGFRYIVEPTRDAAGAYIAGEGNCLSFTLLFLAMADHVGLRATPREVQVPISWRRDGDSLYESGHVNVLVETGTRRAVVDFEPDPIQSRRLSTTRRAQPISRERVLAHFYNNRAAELLADGHAEMARQWSDIALELAPEFSAALNNRGVIESRLEAFDQAQHYYGLALEVDAENSSTLFNLYELYRRNDHHAEAEDILDRLEGLRSRDPYLHWSLARRFEDLGEWGRANRLYRRAIGLRDDEPLFHAGLARVAETLGDRELAERSLGRAMELSHNTPGADLRWDDTLLALKSRLSEH